MSEFNTDIEETMNGCVINPLFDNDEATQLMREEGTELMDDEEGTELMDDEEETELMDDEEYPVSSRTCTGHYRMKSKHERVDTIEKVLRYEVKVNKLMEEKHINYDQAMREVNPTWEEDQWVTKPLMEQDMKVSDIYYSDEVPFVCCNSVLKGIYNDTILLGPNGGVSYSDRERIDLKHSGDIITPYGLRHKGTIIDINSDSDVEYSVISSPWVNSRATSVSRLEDTKPIFEIRTIEGGEMIRRVIKHDFTVGGNNTACLNGKISKEKNSHRWKITIMCEFLPKGYADDLPSLIESVKNIDSIKSNEPIEQIQSMESMESMELMELRN